MIAQRWRSMMGLHGKTEVELHAALEAAVEEAFERFGTAALWWMRRPTKIVPGTARTIAHSLRHEAPARARPLRWRNSAASRRHPGLR
jgi:hypothetical protein